MSIRRSPLLWLNVAALALVMGWLWIAPHRAWDRFLFAVDSGDDDKLLQAVDFALLQDNLRADLTLAMSHTPGISPAVLEGGKQQASFMSSLVEAGSSPAGVRETVRSFRMGDSLTAVVPPEPTISFHYRSPLRVDVVMGRDNAPANETGVFTFVLSGASWKMVRFRSGWLVDKGTQ